VLAIFEVGQCYSKGWGVKEDKKLAFVGILQLLASTPSHSHNAKQGYFQVAARLGDPDAQQELAFCYANGKGCKKDKKEAAKWYRAAVSILILEYLTAESFTHDLFDRRLKVLVLLAWHGYSKRNMIHNIDRGIPPFSKFAFAQHT
jgi:hypothetical protein